MRRPILVIVVILHMAHVPVPAPDLDGEWGGVAIGGFSDPAAWGFVLLGVRPADDIDKGPVRHGSPRDATDPGAHPFGAAAVVGSTAASHVPAGIRRGGGERTAAALAALGTRPPSSAAPCRHGRSRVSCTRASAGVSRPALCIWHI